MFEYKVETSGVRESQEKMNANAKEGWRVIAVSPDIAMGCGIVITYEREKKE